MPDMKKQSNASQTLNVTLLLKTYNIFGLGAPLYPSLIIHIAA